jgi:hypothetical protein
VIEHSIKSREEIIARISELTNRYLRKFLNRYMRPCPNNCTKAVIRRHRVVGCRGCGSTNSEQCKKHEHFQPIESKEQLVKRFREEIRSPFYMLRDYQPIATLLWVLGEFYGKEKDKEIQSKVIPVDETRK